MFFVLPSIQINLDLFCLVRISFTDFVLKVSMVWRLYEQINGIIMVHGFNAPHLGALLSMSAAAANVASNECLFLLVCPFSFTHLWLS